MIVLDTNVLSALMRQLPDAKIIAWLDNQPRTSVWTTSVTILEVRFGLQIMAAGKRRALLLETFETVLEKMGRRIAPFDDAAAMEAADLIAFRQRKGRSEEHTSELQSRLHLVCRLLLEKKNQCRVCNALVSLLRARVNSQARTCQRSPLRRPHASAVHGVRP